MTKRIATAVVALALFVPVLYFAGTWAYPAVVALLGAVAVWEMLGCIGVRARLFLSLPSALLAVAAPLLARVCPGALYPLYLVYGLYLLFASVLFYSKTEFVTLAKTAFTMLFVTFGFASLVLVRDAEPLRYLLIFVAAWSTDTFALFAGKLFGRRKLCEHISPKKTVAGAVGGIIGCIAAFAVYALAVGLLYDCLLYTSAAGAAGRLRLARVDAGRSGGLGHQARLRREGLRQYIPRARRRARPL